MAAAFCVAGLSAIRQDSWRSGSAAETIRVYGQVPLFKLTDQNGTAFGSQELSSRVWVADFIFASCAGTCPQLTVAMRRLQRKLSPEIRFVSVSVDPKRDRPQNLLSYAGHYGADFSNWSFLTGEPREIERLIQQGFRLSLGEGQSPEEPITHSSRFVLVDGKGRIRGTYDGTDPKAVLRLEQDARALLKEAA